jgi:hypothetical protein
MTTKARIRDLTPDHVLVLSDKVKEEQGLGLKPARGVGPLAYLCYCPEGIEAAFRQVFPHTLGRIRDPYGPSRLVWLMEEAALRAVLSAFGLEARQLDHYVHSTRRYAVSFPQFVNGKRYTGP